MIAKIRDIGFSPDTIIIGVDCYFEEGEVGYEKCWVVIEGGQSVFVPFRSVSLSFPLSVTLEQVRDAVRGKLDAFKRAHSKMAQAQQFVGLEFKV